MSGLLVSGLDKAFGATPVLRGVELEVPDGALVAVLGPSGCGKTTLLRVVAGFESADAGHVDLAGRVVDDGRRRLAPERRQIGYVPQEGSLFPHLSVAANVGFGLPRGGERRARVDELLELTGLTGLAERRPHELSGGEQQRVALARALAPGPRLVLLDEPFSALDAGLRVGLRAEVQAVLRAAGATAVLVTHDQEEALSMADLVAIMQDGRIVQSAPPGVLYPAPGDPDIARFLGEANLVSARVRAGYADSALGLLRLREAPTPGMLAGQEIVVLVRPEQVVLTSINGNGHGPVGSITRRAYFGHDAVVHVALDTPRGDELVARTLGDQAPPPGSRVAVAIRGDVTGWPKPAGHAS